MVGGNVGIVTVVAQDPVRKPFYFFGQSWFMSVCHYYSHSWHTVATKMKKKGESEMEFRIDFGWLSSLSFVCGWVQCFNSILKSLAPKLNRFSIQVTFPPTTGTPTTMAQWAEEMEIEDRVRNIQRRRREESGIWQEYIIFMLIWLYH